MAAPYKFVEYVPTYYPCVWWDGVDLSGFLTTADPGNAYSLVMGTSDGALYAAGQIDNPAYKVAEANTWLRMYSKAINTPDKPAAPFDLLPGYAQITPLDATTYRDR